MIDPILQAAVWASRAEHDGAGFTLRICTSDGQWHDVDIADMKRGGYVLHRRTGDKEPVFINPAQVCSVTVEW